MRPQLFLPLLSAFRPLFSSRVWSSALLLLVGAILAPGKRTVTAILRVMGLAQEQQFQRYHRVLNRAVWSSRDASRTSPTVITQFEIFIFSNNDLIASFENTFAIVPINF